MWSYFASRSRYNHETHGWNPQFVTYLSNSFSGGHIMYRGITSRYNYVDLFLCLKKKMPMTIASHVKVRLINLYWYILGNWTLCLQMPVLSEWLWNRDIVFKGQYPVLRTFIAIVITHTHARARALAHTHNQRHTLRIVYKKWVKYWALSKIHAPGRLGWKMKANIWPPGLGAKFA